MSEPFIPEVLELAPVPREQIGPFLLLGLEKDATPEELQKNWAQRVIWARKKSSLLPLEQVNWAREVLSDPQRRLEADLGSLNADTTPRPLHSIVSTFALGVPPEPCASAPEPHPVEPVLPRPDALAASVPLPQIPEHNFGAVALCKTLAGTMKDPWSLPGFDQAPEDE